MFVKVYRRVERAISHSIRLHERDVGDNDLSESIKLRLELNDWACGIAAGVGFGLMHVMMLYGTLLASEAKSMGTLYQDSCTSLPSLVNSAIMSMFFSLLDIILMLLTFYGVRPQMGDGREGKIAIGASVVAHIAATLCTVFNKAKDGCLVALPLLACVVIGTAIYFGMKIMPHYLQGRRGPDWGGGERGEVHRD